MITTLHLVTSLRSELCPACGGVKRPRHSLCLSCFGALPRSNRDRLYALMGKDYREAITEALLNLKAPGFKVPLPHDLDGYELIREGAS